jgi:hypothetical protein
MKVASISNDQASIVWNSLNDHGTYKGVGELVFDYIGDDSEVSFSDLDLFDLADELSAIRLSYLTDSRKSSGGAIDSEIVEPLHKYLTAAGLTPTQLSHLGFWRWFSNIACNHVFWHFIKWRYGSDIQQNWGITSQGSIIEVYFYRAWLRGHKMFDEGLSDPYHYAKLGSSDVWRSHVLRQEFGRDKDFVRAFLDTIYDQDGKTVIGTDELRKKLIPALRAWSSNSTFSHLSYNENLELIQILRNDGA